MTFARFASLRLAAMVSTALQLPCHAEDDCPTKAVRVD